MAQDDLEVVQDNATSDDDFSVFNVTQDTTEPGEVSIDDLGIQLTDESTPKISVGDLVQIGQATYQILKDNEPVVDAPPQQASCIPSGAKVEDLDASEGGRRILSWTYRFAPLLFTEVEILITVAFSYGTKYKGAGQWITSAIAQCTPMTILTGNKVNVSVIIGQPDALNPGGGNPIGVLPININVRHERQLLNMRGATYDFRIFGDGTMDKTIS